MIREDVTIVVNLKTGEELWYNLPPVEAVVVAFIHTKRMDFNTWEYKKRYADLYRRVVVGRYSVALNDWAALRQVEPEGDG